MRRWLEVTTGYMAACQARRMGEERRKATRLELERLGMWLLSTRSNLTMEEIDTDLLVNYIRGRTVFRSKATVSDVVSKLRCWGAWLVQEGCWKKSPLTCLNLSPSATRRYNC